MKNGQKPGNRSLFREPAHSRVLDIEWNEKRQVFIVAEAADLYSATLFTPEELIELGTELVIMGTEKMARLAKDVQ
jgi:hypothetical protein